MRHGLFSLAVGISASTGALGSQYQECKFEVDGPQVGNERLASDFTSVSYYLDQASGDLKDRLGNTCIWDDRHKIHCHKDHESCGGWSFSNGELKHKGCKDFRACPCEKKPKEWDIYKYPDCKKEVKCSPIHIKGSCGRPFPNKPWPQQPQVGNTPVVTQCLSWCAENDWGCMKKCHSLEPIPSPYPPKEESCHKHEHYKSCNKKCGEKKSCHKKCEDKCKKQHPKPCNKCKPWGKECKKTCFKPEPVKLCEVCHKKVCDKTCSNYRSYDAPGNFKQSPHKGPVCCSKCDAWDGECFRTCFPPSDETEWKDFWKSEGKNDKAVSCHKCHPKKPACNKGCKPSPCYKCKPEHKECHKTCKPAPCNKCKPGHKECHKTCFKPHHKVQPKPCHKCKPAHKECHKSCKPSPCHKCKPEHKQCHKTCQKPQHFEPPYPWVKPWPKPVGPCKPFPPVCDTCKPKQSECHKSCISRPALTRFVDMWENDMPEKKTAELNTEDTYEKIQEYLEKANEAEGSTAGEEADLESEKKSEIKQKPEEKQADAQKTSDKVEKRSEEVTESESTEAAEQCRCPEHDRECYKHCAINKPKKPCFACNDCHKKSCNKAKKCKPVHPKPCNVCHKHEDEHKCKKTCYSPAIPAKIPVPCWECQKGDLGCLKHCFIPEHHEHKQPFCCDKCHPENHGCVKHCEKKCEGYPVPPAPPRKKPVPCEKCPHKDWPCLKTCYLTPGKVYGVPEEVKCCLKKCEKIDWQCKKQCWKIVYGEEHHGKPQGWKPVEDKPHSKPASQPPKASWTTVGSSAPAQGKPTGPPAAAAPKPASAPAPAPAPANAPVWGTSNPAKPPAQGQPHGACQLAADSGAVWAKNVVSVPVNPHAKVLGSSVKITPDVSSVYNFEIPASFKGKTCSLFFAFPAGAKGVTTNGQGTASFDVTVPVGNGANLAPQVLNHLNDIPLKAGVTYWIKDHICEPGNFGFEISSKGGFSLEYPQGSNVGLYVKSC